MFLVTYSKTSTGNNIAVIDSTTKDFSIYIEPTARGLVLRNVEQIRRFNNGKTERRISFPCQRWSFSATCALNTTAYSLPDLTTYPIGKFNDASWMSLKGNLIEGQSHLNGIS